MVLSILPIFGPLPPTGTGVPKEENARYPSLQNFVSSTIKDDDNSPAFTNLFSVSMSTPYCMRTHFGSNKFNTESSNSDLPMLLDYYANNLSLPSKQITTGQQLNVGSPYKYVTGTAFSQVNINYVIPRSQMTRTFFERWTQVMANDANQYTDFYDNYVAKTIRVYKWERGGGGLAAYTPEMLTAMKNNPGINYSLARKYKVTACWEIRNAFPYNIGTSQLNNAAASLMNITMGFYYERYRFYPESVFDDYGIRGKITIPPDNYWSGQEASSANPVTFWDILGGVFNSFVV